MNSIGWQLTESSTVGNVFIDGSTEIFKSGKWAFLARELIQNSNDSLSNDKEKLIMKMTLDDISSNIFPDKENILRHLNGTLAIKDLPERCKKFTENAIKILNSDKIRVLKISDYNTDGVIGSEKNNSDVSSQWNALIYDEGNSQKQSENSTGSFGTGKNAPFALSSLNTVFYVTKDKYQKYAVEGVAKLFTSYVNNAKIDRKIYYAKNDVNNRLSALDYNESKERLNKLFLRDEQGTDVIIFGVEFDKEQVKREIIQSIVENFFVLLNDDKLQITVFDEEVSKNNLWNIINKYCDKPIEYTNSNIKYGFIKQYLSVYTGLFDVKEYCEDVMGAGKLKLIIAKGNDIIGKYVAMFRAKGMKIFDYNVRTAQQNFSAIFFPGDNDVDNFLKKIENPTHDYFDPEVRINDKNEKALASKRYNQIILWIRKKIEDYTKINIVENDYLDGMEEYIQLDDTESEESVVKVPDIEIVSYDNKSNFLNPMVTGNTANGEEDSTVFEGKNEHSKNKNAPKPKSSTIPGVDKSGLIYDYHTKFKVYPKITTNDKSIKVAFSLDDFDQDTFNLEIESIGEDNLISDYIPTIINAVDLVNNKELNIIKNKIVDIYNNTTNLIKIDFDRKFIAKYRINIYTVRGEEDEN